MNFAHTVTPGCERCGDHTIAVFVGCCVLLPDCPALRRYIINDEGNADIVAVIGAFDDLYTSCCLQFHIDTSRNRVGWNTDNNRLRSRFRTYCISRSYLEISLKRDRDICVIRAAIRGIDQQVIAVLLYRDAVTIICDSPCIISELPAGICQRHAVRLTASFQRNGRCIK